MTATVRTTGQAVLIAAVTAGLSLGLGSPAFAKRVPCVVGQKGGPKCKVFQAKVKWAADGDTIKPQIKKGRGWSAKRSVRITGIQAPELYDYTHKDRKGECMGVEAAKQLDKLVHGRPFRLVSLHMRAGGGARARLRSSLQVKQGGRWVDPAMVLLEKGLVLWNPDGEEWPWNRAYSRLAEEAADRGVGLWNPVACGKPGPSEDSPLSIKVKWNGGGHETANSEWVRITNEDPIKPVPLGGWRLRDASARIKGGVDKGAYKFIFSRAAIIPPGGSIMVRIGKGRDGPGVFYWGLGKPLFQNASGDRKQMGDGIYLFDPDLEMRAHLQYPCRIHCRDPLAGKVIVGARYQGHANEFVKVKNTSSQQISLDEYEIENVPFFYEFGRADVLDPGKALILFREKPKSHQQPGKAPFQDVTIFRAWGHNDFLFNDSGDAITLRNPLGAPVTCFKWERGKCPKA